MQIERSSQFKRDWKTVKKQGRDMTLIEEVIVILAEQKMLPDRYLDHDLRGKYSGYRECHITPDWLLVYKYKEDCLVLALSRTGTHSELF